MHQFVVMIGSRGDGQLIEKAANLQIMGSHHHQVAILVPDDKLDCLGQLKNFFFLVKNGQLFIWDQCCHLELMAPHYDQLQNIPTQFLLSFQ